MTPDEKRQSQERMAGRELNCWWFCSKQFHFCMWRSATLSKLFPYMKTHYFSETSNFKLTESAVWSCDIIPHREFFLKLLFFSTVLGCHCHSILIYYHALGHLRDYVTHCDLGRLCRTCGWPETELTRSVTSLAVDHQTKQEQVYKVIAWWYRVLRHREMSPQNAMLPTITIKVHEPWMLWTLFGSNSPSGLSFPLRYHFLINCLIHSFPSWIFICSSCFFHLLFVS